MEATEAPTPTMSISKARKILTRVFGYVRFQRDDVDHLRVFVRTGGKEVQLCEAVAHEPAGRERLPWAAIVGSLRSQGYDPKVVKDSMGERIEIVKWEPEPQPAPEVT